MHKGRGTTLADRDEEKKERMCQYVSLAIGGTYFLARLLMFFRKTLIPKMNDTAGEIRDNITLCLLRSMQRRHTEEDSLINGLETDGVKTSTSNVHAGEKTKIDPEFENFMIKSMRNVLFVLYFS